MEATPVIYNDNSYPMYSEDGLAMSSSDSTKSYSVWINTSPVPVPK
jgi:hypothetical protein